jgi:signal transduction histidine kinase
VGTSSAVELTTSSQSGRSDLEVSAARQAVTIRLVDSLLHDVRNPLNALSINLDVLTEKLRREHGEISPAQEKNLKVMREQIFRVDGILKQFAEFMAPRPDVVRAPVDLSESVRQALQLLAHECRRSMLKVRQMIEPDLKTVGTSGAVRFLALQMLFRGVARAGMEGEVDVTLQREGSGAVLRIRDGSPDAREPFPHASAALATLAADIGGEVRLSGPEAQLLLPLA